MNATFINPFATRSLPRLSAPSPAPAPAPAPSGAACSQADMDQIQQLRSKAAVNRHNGTVVGVSVGAIALMCGVGGSVAGAVICGAIGAIGAVSCFSQARMLEQQADALQQKCSHP